MPVAFVAGPPCRVHEGQSDGRNILADISRLVVRQSITGPLAGLFRSGFEGGGLFGLFHEGSVVGEREPAVRYADSSVFEHAPLYHGGGFAGGGLLREEVLIIARRVELVVPPERNVREERTERDRAVITGVTNVTAAHANSCRTSQGQVLAEMARAFDRAGRNLLFLLDLFPNALSDPIHSPRSLLPNGRIAQE